MGNFSQAGKRGIIRLHPMNSSQKLTLLRCPTCGRQVPWQGNPSHPFCSLTCRLVDLGVWLDEGYRIPTVADPAEDQTVQPD